MLANILLILSVFFACYGIAILLVWSGTSFFMVWFVLAALTAAAGIAARFGWWQALPPLLSKGIAALAFVACAFVIGLSVYIMHESRASAPRNAPDNLEWIVVLGAQVRADGSPSKVLRYRLDAALDYLDAHPRCRAIVSGGKGTNEPTSEAACMAAYLHDHGIADQRIVQEEASTNTRENLVLSAAKLQEHGADPHVVPVGIVTNDFHMFRARAIARKQGLAGAMGIAAYSVPWYLPNNLLRECFGVAKDMLVGNM